ncbi:hypothetical protein WR25_15848 [Diploscapter pachys]|uniref:Uncharacterized protein n=1 Tax=Diploscapter pachys TaxID=2018661 RepID=A0A2A2J7T6_9BILA|nr:hypothetical protein WR25_15848 [Diploscapter pachys]
MDILRSLCCCGNGNEATEGPPYERLHRSSTDTRTLGNATAVRQQPTHYTNGGVNEEHFPVTDETSPKEEDEEHMLNKIIDSTQHHIIDAGQFNSPANLNSQEYVTRTKAYDDAIREHDNAVSKLAHAHDQKAIRHEMVDDAGVHVQDWLGRPQPFSPQTLADVKGFAEQITDAVVSEFKIEHKSDVVVDMEL